MGWPRASLFLLAALPALLLEGEGSFSPHSMRYFYTGVSEPGQGLPQFILVGYVDGQLFVQYDSNTRRMESRALWMEKVDKEDPQYWERNTQIAHGTEETFRVNLETARNYYNLSKGFHSLQWMYGCELRPDGSKGGYDQSAYDGRDYISFDKETLTWTATDPKAQNTKRKWEREPAYAQYLKAYLEETCIEWLQRHLKYGKETLLRTEPPVGKVTRTVLSEGREMLICQAYGFYPKEIEATWRKGKEVMEEETFRRNVAPNSDGTFNAWLSIEIDPEERELYRCHIEHAGLREPLVLAWEAPGGSSFHSLRYFYTGVSEPNQGLPRFVAVGYVDGQLFVQYDSNTQRARPQVPWMEKADKEDPKYWERSTQMFRNSEQVFRENLDTLRYRYNQSGGFHSLQEMLGCELRPDGSTGGYEQFAYDGRDYLSFDKDTLTWTAADPKAQKTTEKWEREPAIARRQKAYLEGTCIEWLQKYLEFGKETLLRTERPEGKVMRQAGFDDTESLVCQAYGFYPKEIEVTWRKGGEVLHEDTFHRNTAPYPDGTYHAWLSISIDPKDRDQYRCHVEHASLAEPLVLAWKEPASNLGLIVGCVVAVVLLIAAVTAGSYVYLKKRQEGYKATSTSDGGSNSSSRGSDPTNPTV